MTLEEYRGALDRTLPPPDLKGRIRRALETPPARPRRRALRAALAALAAAACLLTAALAASPELRTAVLTFFRLEQAEQVPLPGESPPDGPELTHALVAGQVEAQYIRLPGAGTGYSYGNGVLFQVEREEDGAPKAVRWWVAEGDALVPLEGRATGFSAAWAGLEYTDTVYWCVYKGEVSCYCAGSAGMAVDYNCTVSPLPGRTDAAILTLSQGSQMGYQEYPMLLDLETGAVTDLLAGTGWEGAAPLREVQWRPDLSAAILSSDNAGWFYCDRAGKTTASLDALTGLEVFSAWFAPDGALLLLTRPDPEGSCYDVWTWDPAGGPPVRTFQGLPRWPAGEDAPCGFQFFFGGSRGLYLTEDGRALVLDLASGETAAMTGPLPDLSAASFLPSPAGDKLLYAVYGGGADGLGISALGVADLETGVFTLLDRKSSPALHESSLGWFDRDRVAVRGRAADDMGRSWLYLYRF